MRKILLSATVMAAILTGCAKDVANTANTANAKKAGQSIILKGDAMEYLLISVDDFETALLTPMGGNIYKLKRTVSANGVLLSDENGVEVYFRKGEGYVKLGKYATEMPISYQE